MNAKTYQSGLQDFVKLDDLLSRCAGRMDIVARILAKFHLEFASELPKLKSSIELGELQNVCLQAHRLKGAALSVSAVEFAEICDQIEESARAGRSDGIAAAHWELSGRFQRFSAAFNNHSSPSADLRHKAA